MWRARLNTLLQDVVSFCYPGRCSTCDADCDGKSPLCDACDRMLQRLESAPACPACGMPVAVHGEPCPFCEGDGVPHYERLVRLTTYVDPVRHLLYRMKYRGAWTLGEFLAARLLEQERTKGLLTETDCLVAVPLHRLRQMSRGYNQAEVIACWLGSRCEIDVVAPVVRLRHTETQVDQHSRARREANLRGAFGLVDPGRIQGRHVVVVDDVTTTGATLQAIARTLKPAKPASLSALVVAIADPKGRDFERV